MNLSIQPGIGSIGLIIPGKTSVSVHMAPTDNCQLWSIGNFQTILPGSGSGVTKEEFVNVLETAWKLASNKRILLVDIRSDHVANLEKIINSKHFLHKHEYTSTNGSKMVIYMIVTTDLMKNLK